MAIDGLQSRILQALGSRGGFGVLDEGAGKKGLLRRSLLWHRAAETPRLDRIVFPADGAIAVVPSWSWMAYTGAIDYFELEFGQVAWEVLQSPWSGSGGPGLVRAVQSDARGGGIALVGYAREYDPIKAGPGEAKLVLDATGLSGQQKMRCVVLGTSKGPVQTNYVMLVQETTKRDRDGSKIYERVGAGFLPPNCIGERGDSITIC